ncbi:Nucleotide-binding universal stress protein, UspA family [Zhouia amylolytica]|uniref:UspA domain-containing protein n=2 Tax=Zhouia amylolytica TaxID=376730 RepID=W2UT14_9FLAO|nr:universal stress protein [Zhouia amylolytica]ETN96472.1 hypothetical protein P278_05500 [Zhouia amylolytica AD3]MCQ0110038.1 universal stress protein [Zhouia amylolytica]SFT08576.1 Nucleotide-binding universal stress protein, UspA family [Zhouia amylolytica]
MKRVLLPTDFSESAWNAIHYGLKLLKDEECHFCLLNTFDVLYASNLVSANQVSPAFDTAMSVSQASLKETLHKLELLENPNHSFEIISRNNFFLDAVKDVVEEKNIELIIMGTKGSRNNKGVGFGSNAVLVIEKVTKCPVLVIPKKSKFYGFKEVILPSSYEEAYTDDSLKPIKDIITRYQSNIRILHIREKDELSEEQKANKFALEDQLEGLHYTFHALSNIDPAMGIKCFTESMQGDLVALISKEHSFWSRFKESLTIKSVNYHPKAPLLVIHQAS